MFRPRYISNDPVPAPFLNDLAGGGRENATRGRNAVDEEALGHALESDVDADGSWLALVVGYSPCDGARASMVKRIF